MSKEYYAHSLEGKPPSEWQLLEKHLNRVAELAKSFAKSFGGRDWGYVAGLWHVLEKFCKVDHYPIICFFNFVNI